ncbi:MAG: cyclase family protein [Acidobacteriota bacterium]
MLFKKVGVHVLSLAMLICAGSVFAQEKPGLWEIVDKLQSKEFVDLTHAFHPGIPHWPGFKDEERITTYFYEEGIGKSGAGFLAHQYTLPGQWGTHVDPPAHFAKGNRFVDDIPVKEMILPMVVLDVSQKVLRNPDYQVTMDDVRAWETRHGQIPPKSFVALRTDWSRRWPDKDRMRNADGQGIAHYPGWSQAVLRYLYEERDITASGHETTDTDPGVATSKDDYSLENYILSRNKYQIELLTNLDKVPEFGAIAIVTFPKPQKGSGFPARVFAILP